MELHLKTQLNSEDYVEARFLHGNKISYFVYACLAILVFCVFFVLCILALPPQPNLRVFTFVASFVGLVAVLVRGRKILPNALAKHSRKLFDKQIDLHLPRDLTITDSHLLSKSHRGDVIWPLDEYHKWKANEKVVMIYLSDTFFQVFPRRWFASDEDYKSFQDLLAQTIGPAGKTRKRT